MKILTTEVRWTQDKYHAGPDRRRRSHDAASDPSDSGQLGIRGPGSGGGYRGPAHLERVESSRHRPLGLGNAGGRWPGNLPPHARRTVERPDLSDLDYGARGA